MVVGDPRKGLANLTFQATNAATLLLMAHGPSRKREGALLSPRELMAREVSVVHLSRPEKVTQRREAW